MIIKYFFFKIDTSEKIDYLDTNNCTFYVLKQNKYSRKYKDHDRKDWIPTVFKMRTSVPWDPLVFYVCANRYNCVVSIQANDTDEYRIYPETVSNKPIIKFARVEFSKYVCLKRDQEVFGKF